MSTDDRTDDHAADELGDDDLPEVIHVAEDLNEYLEKERYKQIFEAKEQAGEMLRNTGAASTNVRTNADIRYIRERVSEAVVGYITEIRRILEETDDGRELWEDTTISNLPVSNAALLDDNIQSIVSADGLQPVEHTPQQDRQPQSYDSNTQRFKLTTSGEYVPIEKPTNNFETPQQSTYYYVLGGVADYLALHSATVTVEYLTDSPGRRAGKQIETAACDPYPPVPTSREVYQRLTQLLGDSGLDLELGEPEEDEWEI